MTMLCSLQSSNGEQDEEDELRSLVKDELEHSGKPKTSQLVQEEKAENVANFNKQNFQ